MMGRGRKTALTLSLTPEDRATLQAWQRARSIPAGQARRARAILLRADGVPISTIVRTVGLSRRFIYKWIARFQHEGVAGLVDRPGAGGRRRAHPARRLGQQDACA